RPSRVRPPDRQGRALGPGLPGQGERERAQGVPRRGLTGDPMDGPVRPDVPPEGPRDPRVFSPEPITRDHPPVLGWAAAVVVVVLLLIAKPWDPGGGEQRASQAAGSGGPEALVPSLMPTLVPSPARMDTAGPEVADFCLDPGVWLVATIEGYGDRARRI